MTDIGSSVLVASILMGMISVPVASQTVDNSQMVSEELPQIQEEENIQEQVTTNTSSDSFTKKVSTAFQEIKTEITPERSETRITDPESDLSIERTPEGTTWSLETPKADLKISETSSKTVQKVETPYGKLEIQEVKGETSEEFDGSDRGKVEAEMIELQNLMDEKKQELEKNAQKTRKEHYSVNLDLEISPEGDSEHVVLRNRGQESINLHGWTLTDRGNYEYGLENLEIEENTEMYFYTNEEDEVETVDEDAENIYGTGIRWNQESDAAKLEGEEGEELVSESY